MGYRAIRRSVAGAAVLVFVALGGRALAGDPPGPGTNLGTVGGLTYMFHEVLPPITAPGAGNGGPACPAGTHVVGGGAEIGGSAAESHITSTYPADGIDPDPRPDDGWLATVWHGSGSPKAFDVMSICAQGKTRYRTISHAVTAGNARTLAAPCPRGTHVSGGGVKGGAAAAEAYVNSSYPYDGADADGAPDDGWKARVYNITANKAMMKVYAICGASKPFYWTVGPVPLNPGAPHEAACPDSRHVTGGGVRLAGAPAADVHPVTIMPGDLGDLDTIPDDEFRVFAGLTGGSSATIWTYAICR